MVLPADTYAVTTLAGEAPRRPQRPDDPNNGSGCQTAGTTPLEAVDGHYQGDGLVHGTHDGDLPMLLVNGPTEYTANSQGAIESTRTLRMTALTAQTNATLPRLSHVVRRLAFAGPQASGSGQRVAWRLRLGSAVVRWAEQVAGPLRQA